MRKNELEKLLLKTVAEALGVETSAHGAAHKHSPAARRPARRRTDPRHSHRRAA